MDKKREKKRDGKDQKKQRCKDKSKKRKKANKSSSDDKEQSTSKNKSSDSSNDSQNKSDSSFEEIKKPRTSEYQIKNEINSEDKMKIYPKSADLQQDAENNKENSTKTKLDANRNKTRSKSRKKIDKNLIDNTNDEFKNIGLKYISGIYNSYTEMIIIDDKISNILDVNVVDSKINGTICSKQMYIISKIKNMFLDENIKINGNYGTRNRNVSLEQMDGQEDTFILKGKEADVKECKAFIINRITQCYKNRKKIKYQKEIEDEIDSIVKNITLNG